MIFQAAEQPEDRCCLGGYCFRRFCPERKTMRRYIVSEALRRDTGHALDQVIEELDDIDRE